MASLPVGGSSVNLARIKCKKEKELFRKPVLRRSYDVINQVNVHVTFVLLI